MDDRSTIGIQEVLARIRASTSSTAPFRLEVVVSTGRSIGSIRILAQCVKGAPASAPVKSGGAKSAPAVLHKERDTIPINDLEAGQYKTILISHIIGYNQYRVIH